MAVEDAPGQAGGAHGVAEGGGLPLVGDRPAELGVGTGHQVLVMEHAGQPRLDVRGDVEQDVVLDILEVLRHLLEPGEQRAIDEHDPVLGMLDDVGQLLGEHVDVEGMADGAAAGDGEVELQVLVVVPGEGGDTVPGLHAEVDQRGGQALHPPVEVAIRLPVHRAVG